MIDQNNFPSDNTWSPECTRINWNSLSNYIHDKNLSFLQINMRSINRKLPELVTYLNMVEKMFTFIILTETWLKDDSDYGFEIDGYKISCFLLIFIILYFNYDKLKRRLFKS